VFIVTPIVLPVEVVELDAPTLTVPATVDVATGTVTYAAPDASAYKP